MSLILDPFKYAAAASGPTFVSYTAASSFATGATKTAAGIAVLTGDLIVVMGGSETQGSTITWTDSATNTYSSRQTNATASNAWSGGSTAVAAGNATLTVTGTVVNGASFASGFGVWVWRNAAYGTSTKETNTNEAPALDLTTTKVNSAICYVTADWDAEDGTSRTWRTVNGSLMTERSYFRDAARYAIYLGNVADAGSIAAKTLGLSAPGGQQTSQVAIEVTTP